MIKRYTTAYAEALEFLTTSMPSDAVLDFRLSDETRERLRFLLETQRDDRLTAKQAAELDAYHDLLIYIYMRKTQVAQHIA
jgi:hypothetical protein